MRLFLANLKLLYQKRWMWGWYFIIGVGIWTFFTRSIREASPENLYYTGFASPLWVLIAMGAALGRLYTDTWNKSNFFCLPGQIETSKKMILFFGCLTALTLSLSVEFCFPWMTGDVLGASLMLASYFFFFYLVSVIIAYHFHQASIVLVSISYFLFPIISRIGLWHTINSFLLNHVWISTLFLFASGAILYKFLGKRLLLPQPKTSLLKNNNSQALGSDIDILEPECFFTQRFKKRLRFFRHSPIFSHLSGRTSIIFKSMLHNWKTILFSNIIFFLICFIFVNRYNNLNLFPFFFSVFGILVGYMCMVQKSDIFFPISRKWRFFIEITTVMTAIFIALIFATIIVSISKLIPGEVIILMLGPDPTNFISFNPKYIAFTVLFLPMTSAFIIIFRNKIVLSVIALTAIAVFFTSAYLFISDKWADIANQYHSLVFIAAMVVSFSFYLITLYFDSFRRSMY